jgi:hypothetical protein
LTNIVPYKYDEGKDPIALLPLRPLRFVVRVLAYGAKKYAPWAWREHAGEWSRMYSATQRHLWAWWEGEDTDPETGLPHLAHAACCVIFLLEYRLCNLGIDDRPKSSLEQPQFFKPVSGDTPETWEKGRGLQVMPLSNTSMD